LRSRGDVPAADRRQSARPPGRQCHGRKCRMSTLTVPRATTVAPIPTSSLLGVEARKMFNTRSGFWLMASIGITATLATIATIIFAPDDELTFEAFATAVGFPMTVILPMVAALAVSSEWSQRSAL